MKQKILLMTAVVLAALLVLLLATIGIFASGGVDLRGDWSYPLENGYEVWRVNSREIAVCWRESPEKTSASTVIDSYVSEVAITDGWLCAKRLTTPQDTAGQYYLLDMREKNLLGPYETEADFEAQRDSLGLTGDLTWMNTTSLKDKGT